MLQTSLTDRLPPIPYTFRGMFNVLTEMLKFLDGEQYFGTVSFFLPSSCFIFQGYSVLC